MELKVLATLKWHYGIPDGENEVSIVLPEFDIHDKELKQEHGLNALIAYGANKETIKRSTEFFYNENDVVFSAEMTEFHKWKTTPTHLIRCDVEITFQYIWEHRGNIYELKPLNVFALKS